MILGHILKYTQSPDIMRAKRLHDLLMARKPHTVKVRLLINEHTHTYSKAVCVCVCVCGPGLTQDSGQRLLKAARDRLTLINPSSAQGS